MLGTSWICQVCQMGVIEFDREAFYQKLSWLEREAKHATSQLMIWPRAASRGLVGAMGEGISKVPARAMSRGFAGAIGGGISRVRRLRDALEQAQGIALDNLTRKLGAIGLNVVWSILESVLHDIALYMGGSVLVGGAVGAGIGFFGAGIGAIPGAAAGASAGVEVGSAILTFLGLKSILEFLMDSIPEVVRSYKEGFKAAWEDDATPRSHTFDAAQASPSLQLMSTSRAAQEFARGHEILMIAMLAGFVAYLTRGNGKLATLLAEVRQSARLGPRVAEWLEKNAEKLIANPSLRQKVFGATGSAVRTVENAAGKGAAKEAAAVANETQPAARANGNKPERTAENAFEGDAIIGNSGKGTVDLATTRGTWGELPVTPAAERFAAQLVRPGDMVPLPRGAMNLQDLGSLASSEGAEFAVIRLDGERYIVRGTANSTTIPKGAKLIGHVHPGEGYMGLSPSAEDMDALGELGQGRSVIFNESGSWRTFGSDGPSSSVFMPKPTLGE
ncbi:DUF6861 domain-containing protein [Massilia horti]|uniref:NAD(+)--protein-arginine ADP-ribosyltransferase Tre1-like N-terminal domain-containing protein n=1 Tax=Massilia horti TaxID=2562153 RepID=A0A4Y9T6Z7_9BURK|nr:hypothetical protein [Massilia horti]TFW33244.1 hypothetical protein E4O92_07230 [Massilia horti]